MEPHPGLLIVLTGSTASGKDTVMANLLAQHQDWSHIITTTTRPVRPREKARKKYYFLSRNEFETKRSAGEFLETNNYAGNYYGTTKKEVLKALLGQTLLWIIDQSGAGKIAQSIKASFNSELAQLLIDRLLIINLKPSDLNTVRQRLQDRGLGAMEIAARMRQDEQAEKIYHFPQTVINQDGQLEQTINEVEKIILDAIGHSR